MQPVSQIDHCHKLEELETVYKCSIEKHKNEKNKLERELAKLLEFQDATTKVVGLPEGSFDGVNLLIKEIRFEMDAKSEFINVLEKDLKETIVGYFVNNLQKEVELCQELKDLAAKYGFVPRAIMSIPSEERSSEHVSGLMMIKQMFDEDVKQAEEYLTKLKTQKQTMLDYKREMGNSSSSCEHTQHIDKDILDVDEKYKLVEKQREHLKDLIKSEMMIYSKKFISPSDINRSIIEIWQEYGIKFSDVISGTKISAVESTSTGMSTSTTQNIVKPEPEVHVVPNPEKQDIPTESDENGSEAVYEDHKDVDEV